MPGQNTQAVVFEKEGVLVCKEVELRECAANEVLVRVRSLGVCGTDLAIFQGYHNHRVRFPIIPGHEWSGEIVEIGAEVSGFQIGDRVVGEVTIQCGRCMYCKRGNYNICPHRVENGVFGRDGAGAQYMVVPAANLHKFSNKLTFEEACLIETMAVAFRGVEKAQVTPHDHVAVIGAGPIGLLAVAAARAFGAGNITLVDLRDNRLQAGREFGATHTINLKRDSYVDKARDITAGEFFNVIIEASGSMKALESLFDVTAQGARISMIGTFHGKPTIDGNTIVRKDLQIYGSVASPNVWETVIALVESGRIPVKRLITHEFQLHDYGIALELMENQDPDLIKAIIKP